MSGGSIFYCPKCYMPSDKRNLYCPKCGTKNPDPR